MTNNKPLKRPKNTTAPQVSFLEEDSSIAKTSSKKTNKKYQQSFLKSNKSLKQWNNMIEKQVSKRQNKETWLGVIWKWIIFSVLLLPAISWIMKITKVQLHKIGYPVEIAVCQSPFQKEAREKPPYKKFWSRIATVTKENIFLHTSIIGKASLSDFASKDGYCFDVDLLFLWFMSFIVLITSSFWLLFFILATTTPWTFKTWRARLKALLKIIIPFLLAGWMFLFLQKIV